MSSVKVDDSVEDKENRVEAAMVPHLKETLKEASPIDGKRSRRAVSKNTFKQENLYAEDGFTDEEGDDLDDQEYASTNKKRKRQQKETFRATQAPRSAREHYIIRPDEMMEDDQLQIIGEDDSDAANMDSEQGETLPCRTIDDFTVYDILHKNEVKSLYDIGMEDDIEIRVSGIVRPIFENDDDDDEDADEDEQQMAPQRVKLSTIFHWEIFLEDNGVSTIWLRTQYAWYRLVEPAATYAHHYEPIYKQVRIANMLVAAMARNPKITYAEFISSLDGSTGGSGTAATAASSSSSIAAPAATDESGTLSNIVYREVDVLENLEFIIEEVNDWVGESGAFHVLECPLLITINEILQKRSTGRTRRAATSLTRPHKTTTKNVNLAVLKHTNPTTVTPWISRIAGGLFVRTLIVAKQSIEAEGIDTALEDVTCDPDTVKKAFVRKEVTRRVKWASDPIASFDERVYYESVNIDGELLSVGDCVCVRPDEEERIRQTEEPDPWFAKIQYMWQDVDGSEQFHARWFIHGSDTLLQETASPRELFLLNECDDIDLYSVMSKCTVTRLGHGAQEPTDIVEPNTFFYRYLYNQQHASFEDAALYESPDMHFEHCADCERCNSCETLMHKEAEKKVQWTEKPLLGFRYAGFEYHKHDFIYILPTEKDLPYLLGQIVMLEEKNDMFGTKSKNGVTVRVRMAYRYDDLIRPGQTNDQGKPIAKDERRLYLTEEEKAIDVDRLEGTCWVQHIDEINNLNEYKAHRDNFYIDAEAPRKLKSNLDKSAMICNTFSICKRCQSRRLDKMTHLGELLRVARQENRMLKGLDIFSGAGGLTIGFDKTGVVDTRWAIEFGKAAAMTFELNNPHATVYNECANILLQRAIDKHDGKELDARKDFQNRPIADMPRPGDVNFIYCGPPCQGFSGINRFKKADDVKNSLIATALSYVDFYRPEYFLLENVRGLLSFRLNGRQVGENKISGGIKMGAVKFIVRSLTSMGYQCRFSIQQAGHHGTPQSRRRVFFWGAKLGQRLPVFPNPSHCFPKQGSLNVSLPNGTSYTAITRTASHAPHSMVTVRDAVNDLPGFEYVNPHEVYPETEQDRQRQDNAQYPQLVVTGKRHVGKERTVYAHGALSDFQRMVRGENQVVTGHVTRVFKDIIIERICNIPMRPGVDHHQLPQLLKPWCLSDPKSAAARHGGWKGLYGRMDFEGHFQTALTDIQPCGKQGTVIHPDQNRVITVREHARSQGFPDSFVFYSDNDDVKDMHRQVGNAVPIPLGYALGLMLRECVLESFIESRGGQTAGGVGKGKGKSKA